jgi:hypothetical protein
MITLRSIQSVLWLGAKRQSLCSKKKSIVASMVKMVDEKRTFLFRAKVVRTKLIKNESRYSKRFQHQQDN